MRPAPDSDADAAVSQPLGPPGPAEILHVGSAIRRKRIDVLLPAFARILRARPDSRLIKVGALTAPQRAMAASLGIEAAIIELPFLDRAPSSRRCIAALACS